MLHYYYFSSHLDTLIVDSIDCDSKATADKASKKDSYFLENSFADSEEIF